MVISNKEDAVKTANLPEIKKGILIYEKVIKL